MTPQEQADANRKVAEWLGLSHPHTVSHDELQAEQSDPCNLCGVLRCNHDNGIPDFFRSEEANALILEKLSSLNAYVWIEWDINEWCVMWLATTEEDQEPSAEYNDRDRKTAIALAALKWIEEQT